MGDPEDDDEEEEDEKKPEEDEEEEENDGEEKEVPWQVRPMGWGAKSKVESRKAEVVDPRCSAFVSNIYILYSNT